MLGPLRLKLREGRQLPLRGLQRRGAVLLGFREEFNLGRVLADVGAVLEPGLEVPRERVAVDIGRRAAPASCPPTGTGTTDLGAADDVNRTPSNSPF